MDTKTRDNAIQNLCAAVLSDTEMTIDAAEDVSEALKKTYKAGYEAGQSQKPHNHAKENRYYG